MSWGFENGVLGVPTVPRTVTTLESYDSPQPVSSVEAETTFDVRLTTLEAFLRRETTSL
jgi:hypothetical protein